MRRVLESSAQRLARLSRLIECVKSLTHPRVIKTLILSCFITERITVFMSFSIEKLRSLDTDVLGAVKIVYNTFAQRAASAIIFMSCLFARQ